MRLSKIILLIFCFFSLSWSHAQSSAYEYIQSLPTKIKVSYDIHNQFPPYTSITHQGSNQVAAASLIKIPILISFLESVENGLLSLDQVHVINPEEIVGGAGELQFGGSEQSLTLEKLATEMIRTSDNTATNILIDYIKMPTINENIKRWGFHKTSLNRFMMDFQAIEAGRQNYTTVQDMVHLLEKVWNGELLNEHSRTLFLKLLQGCEDKSLIAASLPNYTSYNKTGTLDYVRSDAAIIQSDHHTLILAITVGGFDEIGQAETIIRTLAKLLEKEIIEQKTQKSSDNY